MNDNDKPEGTVAFLLGEIKAEQKATNDKLDAVLGTAKDQEARIASLENDRAKTLGGAGVISFIIAAAGAWWSGK